jgi:hypothetical protein
VFRVSCRASKPPSRLCLDSYWYDLVLHRHTFSKSMIVLVSQSPLWVNVVVSASLQPGTWLDLDAGAAIKSLSSSEVGHSTPVVLRGGMTVPIGRGCLADILPDGQGSSSSNFEPNDLHLHATSLLVRLLGQLMIKIPTNALILEVHSLPTCRA